MTDLPHRDVLHRRLTVHLTGYQDVDWDTARELAHAVPPLPPRRLPLDSAIGTTLAEPLPALRSCPAFDAAAMDGYAVTGRPPWRRIGRLEAGQRWTGELSPGTAVEIATGAPLPPRADGVLRYEDAAIIDGQIAGDTARVGHVRAAASDVRAGDDVLPAGAALTPPALGLAAAIGHDELRVHPRPRVFVIVTGHELVAQGPGGGAAVRDALTPMLVPLIDRLGGQVVGAQRTDDHDLLTHWEKARYEADVVVTTGSTSRGVSDMLPALARAVGVVFQGVRCRPGHPQLLAGGGSEPWLVGLPGNPFAAFTAAYTTLASLLAGLSGRPLAMLPSIPVINEPGGRQDTTRLVPATWTESGLQLMPRTSAAFLGTAARQHALAVLDPGWEAGQPARLLLTDTP